MLLLSLIITHVRSETDRAYEAKDKWTHLTCLKISPSISKPTTQAYWFFEFMTGLVMHLVAKIKNLNYLQLCASTHLVLRANAGGVDHQVSFDLLVEHIQAQHSTTEISLGNVHTTFEVRKPAGNTIKFFDSHVIGSV